MSRLLNENTEWQLFPKDFQKTCKAFLSQTKLLTFLYIDLKDSLILFMFMPNFSGY